jgi:magnesium transporter
MNSVMKTMTSWGAILLLAALVAGIYGMNFEHMPELNWLFGYPFALGIMATITVVGYLLFKKRGWL